MLWEFRENGPEIILNMSFEKLIPKQRKMSTKLGGFLIIVGEIMFLFSLLNFLMITRLQYYSSGDSFIRILFPDYLIFMGAMFVLTLIAMWITYVYILPSKQLFSQEQSIKDNRSPIYNEIIEIHGEISELRNMIKKLSDKKGEK